MSEYKRMFARSAVNCPDCFGSGERYNDWADRLVDCRRCRGTGVVSKLVARCTCDQPLSDGYSVDCVRCGGAWPGNEGPRRF